MHWFIPVFIAKLVFVFFKPLNFIKRMYSFLPTASNKIEFPFLNPKIIPYLTFGLLHSHSRCSYTSPLFPKAASVLGWHLSFYKMKVFVSWGIYKFSLCSKDFVYFWKSTCHAFMIYQLESIKCFMFWTVNKFHVTGNAPTKCYKTQKRLDFKNTFSWNESGQRAYNSVKNRIRWWDLHFKLR